MRWSVRFADGADRGAAEGHLQPEDQSDGRSEREGAAVGPGVSARVGAAPARPGRAQREARLAARQAGAGQFRHTEA